MIKNLTYQDLKSNKYTYGKNKINLKFLFFDIDTEKNFQMTDEKTSLILRQKY